MNEFEKTQQEFIEALTQPLLEMAYLDGGIIVNNDNSDTKFAHFHWNGVHFAFLKSCPKNATEIKKMIVFPKEKSKLDDHKLTELAKLLNSKPQMKRGTYNSVYDRVLDYWETLNGRDADYVD